MTAGVGTVHVCASCTGRLGEADIFTALAARLDSSVIALGRQPCFGPCGKGVRLAVTGPGRWGWLFEGLGAEDELEPFLAFLAAWRAAPDGVPPKAARPAVLMRKAVGRLPPSA